jgi:echinoderm microtubule-associated protein-like 6
MHVYAVQAVYYTASVVVIYTPPADKSDDASAARAHSQHFFLGHNNDVRALAPCPAPIHLDKKEYPAYSLFASGQITGSTSGPYVCVWDSRVACLTEQPELRRIQLPKSARGVCALAFSPDGALLTVVTMDNVHTVLVYDWKLCRPISKGRGFTGEPPQVCLHTCKL